MFAHPNPTNIAIVGGREGGALREVLKHKTVKSAVLVEPDEELVQVCRQLLPQMSNCSDLVGRAKDCFEDEHVTIVHEDSRDYFKQHYGGNTTKHDVANTTTPLFDVIIVDDKDPRHVPETFLDKAYISSLVDALSPEGVMMIHAGLAPDISDPRTDMGVNDVREKMTRQLESHPGVEAMLVYEEARTGHIEPTSMLIICKSVKCRDRWYHRSDKIDFEIYDRIVLTHSKKRPLNWFDGTTQFAYSLPPKAWETVYCRRDPTPFECAYLHLDADKELHDWEVEDESKNSFRISSKTEEVMLSDTSKKENKTTSFVHATVDIPAGSYIMPKHVSNPLVITQANLEGLQENIKVGGGPVKVMEDVLEIIDEHSHPSLMAGIEEHIVEMGGSRLIRRVDDIDQVNIGRWVPSHPSGRTPVYSPVYERHRMSFDVFMVATKDIPAGTELLRHSGLWAE